MARSFLETNDGYLASTQASQEDQLEETTDAVRLHFAFDKGLNNIRVF